MNNAVRKAEKQGRYQAAGGRSPGGLCRWMCVMVLLIWDGVLLYMIAECLIAPVYGAVFVGVISIYLGFKL